MDLYSNEQYIEPLRKELEKGSFVDLRKSAEGLPLPDGFLKESARLSAFESSRYSDHDQVVGFIDGAPAGVRR